MPQNTDEKLKDLRSNGSQSLPSGKVELNSASYGAIEKKFELGLQRADIEQNEKDKEKEEGIGQSNRQQGENGGEQRQNTQKQRERDNEKDKDKDKEKEESIGQNAELKTQKNAESKALNCAKRVGKRSASADTSASTSKGTSKGASTGTGTSKGAGASTGTSTGASTDTSASTSKGTSKCASKGASTSKGTSKDTSASTNTCLGHRERLKARFDKVGINGLQNYEAIEMLLFYAIPRKDTKAAAKQLLNEFGSLEKLFWAPHDLICSVPGVNAAAARLIRFFRELHIRINNEKITEEKKPLLDSRVLFSYLKETMAGQREESLRVLFLDSQNHIMKDELFSEGTENQTAVYPKKILKRAMDIRSTGIIVVHNHPSGNLQPSSADIAVTQKLMAAAEALDIRLIDHLIVGPTTTADESIEYYSFHDKGLI